MSATSVGMALSGECLWSKGRYRSCVWQVKLCDPHAIGPYLNDIQSAIQINFLYFYFYFLCDLTALMQCVAMQAINKQ